MSNLYIFIMLLFFLFTIRSDDTCNKINWWDLGNVHFYPGDICLVWDKDYEEKREFYSHICRSNSTEYERFINNFIRVENKDEYKFLLFHFLDNYEDTGQINCYNRTKHKIYIKVINERINEILPRKDEKVFGVLKGINLILEIPNIFYRMIKSAILSGIAYLSYKKY